MFEQMVPGATKDAKVITMRPLRNRSYGLFTRSYNIPRATEHRPPPSTECAIWRVGTRDAAGVPPGRLWNPERRNSLSPSLAHNFPQRDHREVYSRKGVNYAGRNFGQVEVDDLARVSISFEAKGKREESIEREQGVHIKEEVLNDGLSGLAIHAHSFIGSGPKQASQRDHSRIKSNKRAITRQLPNAEKEKEIAGKGILPMKSHNPFKSAKTEKRANRIKKSGTQNSVSKNSRKTTFSMPERTGTQSRFPESSEGEPGKTQCRIGCSKWRRRGPQRANPSRRATCTPPRSTCPIIPSRSAPRVIETRIFRLLMILRLTEVPYDAASRRVCVADCFAASASPMTTDVSRSIDEHRSGGDNYTDINSTIGPLVLKGSRTTMMSTTDDNRKGKRDIRSLVWALTEERIRFAALTIFRDTPAEQSQLQHTAKKDSTKPKHPTNTTHIIEARHSLIISASTWLPAPGNYRAHRLPVASFASRLRCELSIENTRTSVRFVWIHVTLDKVSGTRPRKRLFFGFGRLVRNRRTGAADELYWKRYPFGEQVSCAETAVGKCITQTQLERRSRSAHCRYRIFQSDVETIQPTEEE
ncbi:unnamed protein product [Nesidiocoris tenuis]|uniref:Uncharacterized protein n=1 Tax=Nesidiocoris tenuis TaxID=355587 RepID=A0A6H5GZQ7_9HEMI|nr:unnamed protein product [Nesidiocoris tenuis]